MRNYKFSYDGFGINLKSREYSPRVATFVTNDQLSLTERDEIGRLFEASPQLLEALKILLIQFGEYKDGDGAAKYHAINIAKEAIAKVERE